MKKGIGIGLLTCALAVCLCACGNGAGNSSASVSDVPQESTPVSSVPTQGEPASAMEEPSRAASDVSLAVPESGLYTNGDIASATEVAKEFFKTYYPGCTLNEISYIGDEATKTFQHRAQEAQAEECIVLEASYTTGENPGPGMQPNHTYTEWKCFLVRNKGEAWRVVGAGYAPDHEN